MPTDNAPLIRASTWMLVVAIGYVAHYFAGFSLDDGTVSLSGKIVSGIVHFAWAAGAVWFSYEIRCGRRFVGAQLLLLSMGVMYFIGIAVAVALVGRFDILLSPPHWLIANLWLLISLLIAWNEVDRARRNA